MAEDWREKIIREAVTEAMEGGLNPDSLFNLLMAGHRVTKQGIGMHHENIREFVRLVFEANKHSQNDE